MPRVSTRVRNSATGIASHAPVTPRNRGRISRDSTINTSVRKNEIIADTLPLDNAVKKPEDVILIPLNRKLMAKIRKPASARAKVSGSWVKMDTSSVEVATAARVMRTDDAATKRNEVL